ncbi:MAG: hypothetical protein A3C22_02030 [Candidatus Levybacteria bacterium RIFCSPHIGHO2_02_FULL_37_10]|nr:MAG: hypothetical protein A3C22_02030 [Candidatus Levybacteria bacterium RIFCSPHIGHO2_02_FULL_37_10]
MAEEKMMHHKGKILEILGILAIVYGVGNYLMVGLNWPSYGAWIVGGAILVLLAWAKKAMMNN